MNKQILEEINRVREIMTLSRLTMINESVVLPFLKNTALEAVQAEVQVAIRSEAKKYIQEYMEKVARGEAKFANMIRHSERNISKERLEKMFKEIETATGKTLDDGTKTKITTNLKLTMIKETEELAQQTFRQGMDAANAVGKQSTKKSTWQKIKEHIKRNKGKYALGALAVALAAYAYFYPGETPPEEEEEDIIPPVPEDGKYRDCPDLPFAKFCKNPKLKKIQECIGAKPDGYYGPETETKLKEKGYSTTITQEVYDEIIKNCDTTQFDDESGSVEYNIITGTDV